MATRRATPISSQETADGGQRGARGGPRRAARARARPASLRSWRPTGWRPHSSRSAARAPVPVEVTAHRRSAIPRTSSRPPTSWPPRRSRTSPSTPALPQAARHGRASQRAPAWSRSPTTASAAPARTPAPGWRDYVDRVAALNGTLTIESPEDRGTTVRAELPLREAMTQPVTATVLIVDDHEQFRARARKLLQRAGYKVVGEAADGAAAIAARPTARARRRAARHPAPRARRVLGRRGDRARTARAQGRPHIHAARRPTTGARLQDNRRRRLHPQAEAVARLPSSTSVGRAWVTDALCGVVIADDSMLVREGIARVLVEARLRDRGRGKRRRRAACARSTGHKPDVAVVDIRMPPTGTDEGLRAANEIGERQPRRRRAGPLRVPRSLHYATRLLEAGTPGSRLSTQANGHRRATRSPTPSEESPPANPSSIRPSSAASSDACAATTHSQQLSDRERDILALMAEGKIQPRRSPITSCSQHARSNTTSPASSASSGCPSTADDHRRVLAVLAYIQAIRRATAGFRSQRQRSQAALDPPQTSAGVTAAPSARRSENDAPAARWAIDPRSVIPDVSSALGCSDYARAGAARIRWRLRRHSADRAGGAICVGGGARRTGADRQRRNAAAPQRSAPRHRVRPLAELELLGDLLVAAQHLDRDLVPGLLAADDSESESALVTFLPSIAVTMSPPICTGLPSMVAEMLPPRRPALSAGLPAVTLWISAPCLTGRRSWDSEPSIVRLVIPR